jgi:4-aminobutyrate aminotransferase
MEAPMSGRDSHADRTEGDINLSPRRQAWQAQHLDPAARDLLAADAGVYLHQSLSTPCLNAIQGAEGAYLIDTAGRRILDFHGNSAHQVGHGHPQVAAAVKAQLDALPFAPRRYTHGVAVDCAKALTERAPGDLDRVLFTPGGTSAVGMALKLARAATGRFKTISWWDSFHGASLDAISVGGEALFRQGMGPLMPGAIHVPPPSVYRPPVGTGHDAAVFSSPDYIEYIFEHEGDIAAFIAEPMRCTTVDVPPAGYWRRVRELCDHYGALLIFDEIPICLGRTGKLFAFEHTGVHPDIVCWGKGLGGGVIPFAAMFAREGLNIAPHIALGHYTHEKSPLGCAAAMATLDVIEREGLVQRAADLGSRTLERLRVLMDRHAIIGDVRGQGLVIGVELVRDRATKEPAHDAAEAVLYGCLERGLSFKISGGNVLTLMPPLTISETEMDQALAILDEALGEA